MASREEKRIIRIVNEILGVAEKAGDETVKRVVKQLDNARKEVAAAVASTEWQLYRLPEIKAAVNRAIEDLGRQMGIEVTNAQKEMWELGVEKIDQPLRSVGRILVSIPEIDVATLSVFQEFGLGRIANLTADASSRINTEISLGLMGGKSPYDVMLNVGRNLKDKGIFNSTLKRAETIVRNEAGRALEKASSDRQVAAGKVVPGLMKVWFYGHHAKMPRLTHLAAADRYSPGGDPGPIPVDKPFMIDGEALMYPKDPSGSAANTINCGCTSIPYHPRWKNLNSL